MEIKNEKELNEKLAALGDMDDKTRNDIVCSLLGHSLIQESCFGYFTCSRCGAQLGDSLGGYYDATKVVIVGHDCDTCRSNYEKLDWKHKVFTPNPFALKSYNVKITEILEKIVTVEAADEDEACKIVKEDWVESKLVLDADDFSEVKYTVLNHMN